MKKSKKTKKWLVPAAVGAAVVAIFAFMGKDANAAPNPNPNPLPPPPPNPPQRPRVFPNAPPGSGRATTAPACGPNDLAKCRNGLLIHSSPNADPSTLVAPEDTSPTSIHLVTGDVAVVLQDNIPDQSNPKTTRLWAEVINPLGQRGFVSSKDPQGRSNWTDVVPVTEVSAAVVSGVQKHFARPWNPYGWR